VGSTIARDHIVELDPSDPQVALSTQLEPVGEDDVRVIIARQYGRVLRPVAGAQVQ
jgi:hypothetical protein